MRTRFVKGAPLAGALLFLCAGHAAGQTVITWAGGTGSWSDMAQWSPMTVPNNAGPNTFDAVIGGSGTFMITLDINPTIENFTFDNTGNAGLMSDNAAPRTLTVNQNFAASNGVTINGGSGANKSNLTVNGITDLGSGNYQGFATFQANGIINYNPTTTVCEIDDSDVVHNDGHANIMGTQDIVLGNNTTLTNMASCTMTISNDQQIRWNNSGTRSTLTNNGMLIRDTGAATASISGVTFANTGTVETRTGTLSVDQLVTTGSTLSGGTYRIMGGSFNASTANGNMITTNAATVEFGAGSGTFTAFNSVTTNAPAGTLRVSGGRTYTTGGSLQNDGLVDVQASSTLAIPSGSTLTNVSGSTLTGGTFMVAGTLQAQNLSGISTIASTVMLNGTGSQIVNLANTDALTNVATIASGGELGVLNGRNFTTASDLTLGTTGMLRVGTGSNFTVNGTITNFASGTITDGQLSVAGRLQFNDADINTVAANLTLNDAGAQIVDQNNQDAFRNLNTVTAAGSLSISDGRNLSTSGALANAGALNVGAAGSAATTLSVSGALNQTAGSTTLANGTISATGGFNLMGGTLNGNGSINGNIVSNGVISPGASPGLLAVTGNLQQMQDSALNIQIGGLNRGIAQNGYDALDISGALTFDNAAAGSLNVSLIDGFAPAYGQSFEIITFASRDGLFASLNGLQINSALHFEVVYSATDITLVVVPAPGVLGVGALAGLAALRRRR
ncbi:MAG: hypothetical protein GC200_09075 [Tepidisphaera sp.]|nr:hypothetical protein [Tepidisphaera sp.]